MSSKKCEFCKKCYVCDDYILYNSKIIKFDYEKLNICQDCYKLYRLFCKYNFKLPQFHYIC